MDKPKRKYQKRNTDKVVSVTHHLNTRLKSRLIDGKACFPLYIIVYYNGQTTNVKSRLDKYVAEEDFEIFEQEFKDELKKESKTIREKIKRVDDSKEPIQSQYFLQGVQSLSKTIHQCMKLEMKLLVALKDDDFLNHYERHARKLDSNVYGDRKTLIDFSFRVRLINWDEFDIYDTLRTLVSLMPCNEELKSFYQSLNHSLTIEDMYEATLDAHFPNGATVDDWRTGRFPQDMLAHFEGTEYIDICKSYVLIINKLLKRHKNIS